MRRVRILGDIAVIIAASRDHGQCPLLGLLSVAGDSLATFAAPKITRNSTRFRSKNVNGADFFIGKAKAQ